MSLSPASSPHPRRPADNISRVHLRAESIALVVNTRKHYPLPLIPALVHHGFTSAERPVPEAAAFLDHLRPGLVVAIVDPQDAEDRCVVQMAARSGAYVLVLAPSVEDFAQALEAGADVCLPDEATHAAIGAQIGAIRRRLDSSDAVAESDRELAVGDFRLDPGSRRLLKGGTQVPLTAMEFSVLAHLAENAGKATSALDLLRNITGRIHSEAEASRAVKVYIRRLRQKLEAFGGPPDIITTVRGYGYMVERHTLPS